MRLIDADALLTVIDEVFFQTDPNGEEQIGMLKARTIIRTAPTIDAVPVVRCKDCEFSNDLICPGHSHDALEDGFCMEGRRNDG